MLMYFYVHCAFFFLKSYYMTHSPPFLEKVYNGRLVRCLRVKSVLTYFYVPIPTNLCCESCRILTKESLIAYP